MPKFMGNVVREDCDMKNRRVYPAPAGVLTIVLSLSERLAVSSDLLSKIGVLRLPFLFDLVK